MSDQQQPIVAQPSFDYGNLSHLIPMMGMRSISTVQDWMNVLIYAEYGDGKTHLAGTAALVPEMRDILYVSLEGGEMTLRTIAAICKENNVDPDCIMVMPVQTYRQYAQLHETVKAHITFRDSNNIKGLRRIECQLRGVEMLEKIGWQPQEEEGNKIVAEMSQAILALSQDDAKLAELIPVPKKFRSIIIDSLTEAQKYCMYQILGIDPLKQRIDAEPDAAEWKDWGSSREMIQFLVRRLRDLDIHTTFIAAVDYDEDSKKQKYASPMLPGKLSKDVQGLVDIVGFLKRVPTEGGQVKRILVLEGGAYGGLNIAAKHRFGRKMKGTHIEDPTMRKLYDLSKQ